jgi:predicted MFS family arabinose efflux permease
MADTIGWRLSFALLAIVLAIVAIILSIDSRKATFEPGQVNTAGAVGQRPSVASMATQFGSVVKLPWARVILAVFFLEGLVVYSAFAYVPSWLHLQYQLSLWQAGLAAAGFGLGGVCYSLAAGYLIRTLGEKGLLLGGSGLFALGIWATYRILRGWLALNDRRPLQP